MNDCFRKFEIMVCTTHINSDRQDKLLWISFSVIPILRLPADFLVREKGMDNLMKGRTVLVIAHRLSTVRNSDAIMFLDHGRIIERGTHDQLIEQKGTYYQLYTGAFELE